MVCPARLLKKGSRILESIKVIKNAKRQSTIDSLINCLVSCDFIAPATFRIPTSRARSADLAVVRFTKFMQAINNIKMAITEKI